MARKSRSRWPATRWRDGAPWRLLARDHMG